MVILIVGAVILVVLFAMIFNNIGRTCADCKYLKKCWKKLDDYAFDNPACEHFEEEKNKEK